MRMMSLKFAFANVGKMLAILFRSEFDGSLKEGYRQTSNISHTKPQNLKVSRLVLQLSLPNPVKPGVKSILKM